ncbi:MAG: CBS domain-containing protein [Thermoplasmatota archaeon]
MKDAKVRDVMTESVVYAEAPGKKADALKLMVRHGISGLPVVRRGTMDLVGIVTRRDIFNHPHEEQLAMTMTRSPVVVEPETPLRAAVHKMEERRLRRLPVVKDGRLVGILTCMDILKVIDKMDIDAPIEPLLKGPCVPVYEGTPLPVVAAVFQLSGAYALPVLDARARIIGIVTDQDLYGISRVNSRRVMSSMGLGEDEDQWNYEGVRNLMRLYYEMSEQELPGIPVRKVMVRNPVTVTRKTSAGVAARKMREHNFRQLPVKDSQDRVQAMLFDMDLVQVLLR